MTAHPAATPLRLTAAIHREGDAYVAQCLEFDVASCGDTFEEAVANIREAMELYLEEVERPAVVPDTIVTTFTLAG